MDYKKVIFGTASGGLSFFSPTRRFIKFYKGEIGSLDNKELKILDVGCGSGGITKALKQIFSQSKFIGCDISPLAIAEAKKLSGQVEFKVADIYKLPFKASNFDVVIANSVLDHLENPAKAFREVRRVLNKGGIFLLSDPLERGKNLHGFFTHSRAFRRHRERYLGHTQAFDIKSLKKLIHEGGFKVSKIYLDWFFLSQFIDISYHLLMEGFKMKPGMTLNAISRGKSQKARTIRILRGTSALVENIESELFEGWPEGYFAYVNAVKK